MQSFIQLLFSIERYFNVMETSTVTFQEITAPKRVMWRQVGLFIGLTFGLTWLLDLAIYLMGGLTSPIIGIALQLQMLLPAASILLLGMFIFRDHPLYYENNRTPSRWFNYYFLGLTALYIVAMFVAYANPALVIPISQGLLLPGLIGMLLWIVLRIVGKKQAFESINMAGGKPLMWLLFGVAMVAFYGLQTYLNYAFNLGSNANLQQLIPGLQTQTLPDSVILLSLALNTILIGPFLGILISFGEEYGWRGYLQPALEPLGKVKGTLLLGVIWGIWHWPVIWMGYNYPGQPILGSLMMVGFTVALAFILAYSVYKGKGLWIAAFLHALNNQTLSFFNGFVYNVNNPTLAFGMGVFGLLCFTVVILLILRDPVWKD
jgi:uncharacterized protein